jgi:hypothetical protein
LDRAEGGMPSARFAEVLEQKQKAGIREAFYERHGNTVNWPEIERIINDNMYPDLNRFDPESGELITKIVNDTNSGGCISEII